MFREPVQQVLEKIKNEPFFKWPNKMAGEPKRRNPNLYCHYHQDHGHTMEDCRNLWDHLEHLVQEGKLKQLLHHSSGRVGQVGLEMRGDASSRLPLGTINVIFAAQGGLDLVLPGYCQCFDLRPRIIAKRQKEPGWTSP